ncbi:MAG: hypothetical protein IPM50_06930 [Acidobacteriota bacterium]|nr:MAG: hypothetical protein IPM50_06930 [Acidobacteriota bacterium]
MLERIFQVFAFGLAVLAGYFFWADNREASFIAAVLGSVSFFLSIRTQVVARNKIRESERLAADESES